MNVIKRDCTEVPFNKEKISNAIMKAMPYGEGIKEKIALKIAEEIEQELLQKQIEEVEIYTIESMVFNKLIKYKQKNTAKAYEGYRQVREYQRYVLLKFEFFHDQSSFCLPFSQLSKTLLCN